MMKQEYDDILCRSFPLLYRHRGGSMVDTCMCWGFPGDGWFQLLYDLSTQLEPLIAAQSIDERASAAQVKEKFGGLRFYLDGQETKEMSELIGKAERRAEVTCEGCGEPGKIGGGGWLKCLCETCRHGS